MGGRVGGGKVLRLRIWSEHGGSLFSELQVAAKVKQALLLSLGYL